ncbi:hypothetical protein MPH_10197 [Macrophomina phaseolina MS6]|uniref:Uncharacterized protein n=1 Tax=Macrophomina phaseolina (strain MS6) TaxID=1126212 RepID=K2RDK9_MACPH|nr:hypothetical protein MPH_10197 [Macrophomina phaseolina MS6]
MMASTWWTWPSAVWIPSGTKRVMLVVRTSTFSFCTASRKSKPGDGRLHQNSKLFLTCQLISVIYSGISKEGRVRKGMNSPHFGMSLSCRSLDFRIFRMASVTTCHGQVSRLTMLHVKRIIADLPGFLLFLTIPSHHRKSMMLFLKCLSELQIILWVGPQPLLVFLRVYRMLQLLRPMKGFST